MERIPKSGEFYRHFKNKLYQVLTVAEHSETGEKFVVYQALYGDFKTYARPLGMFISEVDHVKYPEVTQKYRFERVELQGNTARQDDIGEKKDASKAVWRESGVMEPSISQAQDTAVVSESVQEEEPGIDAKMMEFLDTDDFDTRYNILVSMRDTITDMQINNLAVAMDVVIPEGDLDDRYEQLKMCLRTKQRYESNRLR